MTGVLLTVASLACADVSIDSLRAHVAALAADSMEGRGLGTCGIRRAEAYLRRELASRGFSRPSWVPPDTVRGGDRPVVNVIAGAGQDSGMIALCAHYDHLGLASCGTPLPGAHDNASGVAVVLEAARVLRDPGGILVCLFSGEEEGRVGSQAFVGRIPSGRIRAALCIDAVGHLDSTVMVIGGAGQPTLETLVTRSLGAHGVRPTLIPSLPSGDHVSFLEHGIPALGLSTGPHLSVHTTEDDASILDYEGMATIARAVVDAARSIRPDVALEVPPPPAAHGTTRRTVRLGTLPDHAFEGPGLRVADVVRGSPAEEAGIAPGDLLVAIDDRAVEGVASLARILGSYAPGDTVRVTVVRGNKKVRIPVRLAPRE